MDVMIVDDELAGRRTLREYCEAEEDLRVVGEFADGNSALGAIRARPPQLLFLDIQMDPLNGIDLARALEPQHLPSLVFVTAYDSYALEAFEVCAVDYLLKPFDQERFRKTLARVRPRHAASSVDQRQTLLAGLLAQLERGVRALVGLLGLVTRHGDLIALRENRLDDIRLRLLPFGIQLVQLRRESARLLDVIREEQLDHIARIRHTPSSIDTRRNSKRDLRR